MRRLTTILTLVLLIGISLISAMNYDSDWFVPNTLMTCFKMDSIGRFDGKLDFQLQNGVVHTNMESLNKLAETYRIVDLKQAHPDVLKPTWNDEGKYLQCVYRVIMADDTQMDAAMAALAKDPNVLYSEFETINRSYFMPNDPMITQQYALYNTNCFDAWDYVTGSENVLVGITDSGVKWNHPDLRENIWINPAEAPGMTINWDAGTISGGDGNDSPNDGGIKIDDIMGWDFFPVGQGDNNPYQNYSANDHGTHVSGCAGAVFNNAIGVSGTCPNVSIIVCKGASNTSASTGISDGYNMIKYAAEQGAAVVNASWGGPGSGTYPNQVVNYITALGSLLVTAAGNANTEHGTGYNDYPADATAALCVAATNSMDMKADFSDFGNTIDICAPGAGILSTIIEANGYAQYDGTSMASPLTAGIAALVKSVNPELTSAELRSRLMDTADWIYDVNPTFLDPPMLGSGRVNAFNATMFDKIPNLTIADQLIEEADGDGDGICNPGETIRLKLQLNNLMDEFTGLMWLPATNVIAKLRCDYPGVVISDSVSTYGNMGSGASMWNNTDFFAFTTVSTLPSEPIPFRLYITSNQSAAFPYAATRYFTINLSLVQSGWPMALGGASSSSAAVVNLDADNANELVYGDQAGKIHAVNPNGTELPGFPYQAASAIVGAVAVADVTSNPGLEIVACVNNSHIICLSSTGALLWDVAAGGTLRSNPIIANLNMTGAPEIIAFTQTGSIVALTATGQTYPNFPVTGLGAMLAPGAVADLNNDGQLDIVVATLSGNLQAINSATGTSVSQSFPVVLGNGSQLPVTIANIDADPNPEILISTTSTGQLFAINHDGSQLFQKNIGTQVKSGCVVANITGDANPEIIQLAYNGDMYVMTNTGVNLPGFPHNIGQNVECTPVIANFDTGGQSGIVFGDTNGKLHSFRIDGTESPNFPITLSGNIKVSPALGDFDQDGDLDIAFPNDTGFYVMDIKRNASAYKWALWMGNNARSGNVYQVTPNADDVTPVQFTALKANYPNPFNPTTSITYALKSPDRVELAVFNTKGQKVKTLVNEAKAAGNHQIVWDGTDDNGYRVSSGVYFSRMTAGSYTASHKMILMK